MSAQAYPLQWPDLGKRHLAILGMNGSGKTSAAKTAIVEPVLRSGQRAVIIDPTGVWWGLRLTAQGQPSDFKVYIFGGEHGDMPLRARDAGVLAEAFGTTSDSAVLDTSLMTVGERMTFFTEFAGAIMRKNRGPLHLVIDEAHLFMPQSGTAGGGLAPAMLHAGNNLVSLGRARGLRVTMITQRPAKLHKDSLTQAQALIAMRVMAPQDRKAIAEWIAEQADPVKGREITESLATLKPGEGWVWAPADDFLDRIRFPLPSSYDSSRAPDEGDGSGPDLQPLNMDALRGRLGEIEAEVKASDPKVLKAEIAALRHQLADQKACASEQEVEAAFLAGRAEGIKVAEAATREAFAELAAMLTGEQPSTGPARPVQPASSVAKEVARPLGPAPRPVPPRATSQAQVSPTARAIIDVIHRAHPTGISFDAAARRAGASKRSSAYRKYRQEVLDSGEVQGSESRLQGLPEFALVDPLPPDAALHAWVQRLPPTMGRMLGAIAEGHRFKAQIAAVAGVSPTSSGLGSGLRELVSLELVEHSNGEYHLAEGLA